METRRSLQSEQQDILPQTIEPKDILAVAQKIYGDKLSRSQLIEQGKKSNPEDKVKGARVIVEKKLAAAGFTYNDITQHLEAKKLFENSTILGATLLMRSIAQKSIVRVANDIHGTRRSRMELLEQGGEINPQNRWQGLKDLIQDKLAAEGYSYENIKKTRLARRFFMQSNILHRVLLKTFAKSMEQIAKEQVHLCNELIKKGESAEEIKNRILENLRAQELTIDDINDHPPAQLQFAKGNNILQSLLPPSSRPVENSPAAQNRLPERHHQPGAYGPGVFGNRSGATPLKRGREMTTEPAHLPSKRGKEMLAEPAHSPSNRNP